MLFFEKNAAPALREPKNFYFPAAFTIESRARLYPQRQK